MDVDMKTLTEKRKKTGATSGITRASKKVAVVSKVSKNTESENELPNSCSTSSQQDQTTAIYTFDAIRDFLKRTKNKQGVRVEEYFPDIMGFIDSVQCYRKDSGDKTFTDQEIARLKKFLTKLRQENVESNIF